jgi:geranylgeranyl reductase family protein
MDATDVVVVGAGPAGSSAAYFLAANGIKVTLIDKSEFPREKTCGDGVGPRAISMLEKMGLLEWASSDSHYKCNKARLIASNGDYFEAGVPDADAAHPHFLIIPRRKVDQRLVENAISAGAVFVSKCKAVSIIKSGSLPAGVRVQINGQEDNLPCKMVVCADGTHGTFVNSTGLYMTKPLGLAARAYYSNVKGLDDCISIAIDKSIPEGYVWVFPTSETTANIGIGIIAPVVKKHNLNIKQMLKQFAGSREVGPVSLENAAQETEVRGAFLRMGMGRRKVIADGVILAGDAASLVSPLSGEGIAYALESGELAALTIIDALKKQDVSMVSLNRYQDQLNNNYYNRYRICHVFRRSLSLFNSSPLDAMIQKGIRHANLAEKFTSVIINTAHPKALFSPRYIRYYI